MEEWGFLDFIESDGGNAIRAWLDSQPLTVQAKINGRLLVLRHMAEWPPQYVSAYKGYEKIMELRVTHFGVQYRPLGCFGPRRGEFTLLIGAIEKGGKIPKPILETAVSRRDLILSDRRHVNGHAYDP